jgi:hypothetical protein
MNLLLCLIIKHVHDAAQDAASLLALCIPEQDNTVFKLP